MRGRDSDSDDDERGRKGRKRGPAMPNFDLMAQMGGINMLDMVNEHGCEPSLPSHLLPVDFNIAKLDKIMDQ